MKDFSKIINKISKEAYIENNKVNNLQYYKDKYRQKFDILESAIETFYIDEFSPNKYHKFGILDLININIDFIEGCLDKTMKEHALKEINDYFINHMKNFAVQKDSFLSFYHHEFINEFKGIGDMETFVKIVLGADSINIYRSMLSIYEKRDAEFYKLLISSVENKTNIDDNIGYVDFSM